MAVGLTVKQLIEHLNKYPSNLVVSIYRPPFSTAYRVLAPTSDYKWLYNTRRLYIPIEETQSVRLPGNYKLPKLPSRKRRKKDE